jgi:hypothetical protein
MDTTRPYANVIPYLAVVGRGTATPGAATDTFEVCSDLQAIGAGNAHVRLHAMTVTIQADAAPLSAIGRGYFGVMPGNINRAAFASWNALAATVVARVQAKQFTAYQTLGDHPPVCTTYPMDVTQWNMFDLLESTPSSAANARQTDGLAPMAIVFQGQADYAVTYQITICAEWRVIFTLSDARSSLHEKHSTTPAPVVDQVVSHAANVAGDATIGATGAALMGAAAVATGVAGAGFLGSGGRQELRRAMRAGWAGLKG